MMVTTQGRHTPSVFHDVEFTLPNQFQKRSRLIRCVLDCLRAPPTTVQKSCTLAIKNYDIPSVSVRREN